ncbi:MAG: efflux RND transporter permease subunit [Desulfobacteraceae bacterium]|nr:MAG: efflux RND transporter permease subunit [Desulfobacteraceae bacterium]
MNGIIKWMANNHVASNLLMFLLVAGGLIKGIGIKQEVFPEFSLDRIMISVSYPGAGPEEVEEGILLKIEDSLTGIDGIKEITSTAREGNGTVIAETRTGENVDLILQDIKSEIDRIDTFPEDSEKPVVSKILNIREVASVVVYGKASERALREQAETIRDELLADPRITQVELTGVRPYEIAVEVPEKNLRQYNLTLDQVAGILRQASLDLPGGNIKTRGGEILLRTKEKRYRGLEYENIVIRALADGTQLRLKDIAHVRETFEETDVRATFDGQPAAMVKVYRVGDQKPTEISDIIQQYVEEKNRSYPDTLHAAIWNDSSEILESRINLLLKNAFFGLILVFITLGLFLEIRLAFWVMLGIPISFFGSMLVLPAMGGSINMISLFAFILALGILVDDAIVIGENIFEQRQRGKSFGQAAIDGALEVGIPVIFSVLTTVAAFIPLAFVTGMMGKVMVVIPMVVITLLLVSLVESLLILPSHLSKGSRPKQEKGFFLMLEQIRRKVGGFLQKLINGPYTRLLNLGLQNRYTTLALSLALLMLTAGLLGGGILKFTFMPVVDGDVITVNLRMPPGTPVDQTQSVVDYLIEKAMETVKQIDSENPDQPSVFRHIYALAGSQMRTGGGPGGGGQTASGGNVASVALFLTKSEIRKMPSSAINRLWREKAGELPGVEALTFDFNMFRMGANIDIEIAHTDFSVLAEVSDKIKSALAEYPGIHDIEDSYNRGKQELKLKLRADARTLGITETDLARQVRGAFYGAEALRLQIGRNEVKIMVRYPESDRRNLWDLNAMRIRTPGGGELPLSQAAVIEESQGYSEISRTDRKRVINVTASVDSTMANTGEILSVLRAEVFPGLKNDYPGLIFNMAGEQKEQQDSISSLREGFLLALLLIYALLAIPFRSYAQPILIMAAIPFGIVGAVIGHLLMGYQMSILSLFGLIALSGVVVNDSLLLIDTINKFRREGIGVFDSVIQAGQRRFRPILLTSLTTFFGLTPMILETSVQAKFLIPMAISLGFGVMFATGITLVLIPCLYFILEDCLNLLHRGKEDSRSTESVPSAI